MTIFSNVNLAQVRKEGLLSHLKYSRDFFSVCAVHIRLGDRTNVEEFTDERERKKERERTHTL